MTELTTIDAYLDRLVGELRGRARDVRRILAEVEAHLADATDEAMSGGLDRSDAEAQAIVRFGSPRMVARRFANVPAPGQAAVVAELAGSLVRLATIRTARHRRQRLLVRRGDAVWGAEFVVGDAPPPDRLIGAVRCDVLTGSSLGPAQVDVGVDGPCTAAPERSTAWLGGRGRSASL